MKADKMKETIDRYYEQIEVPADLEARLSAAIDALAAEEAAAQSAIRKPGKVRLVLRLASVAACIALIVTVAVTVPYDKKESVVLADTFTNVDDAYRETEKILLYVSQVMNKGIQKVDKTSQSVSKANNLNKYIEIKKK